MSQVVSIAPHHYIHVLDTNSKLTRVVTGPNRFTPDESEEVIEGPTEMIKVPPRCYVGILNPHIRGPDGSPVKDDYGQVKLSHGDSEYRLYDDFPTPFPLYPGECLETGVQALTIVENDQALRLKAVRNFTMEEDGKTQEMSAGDEWLFRGPATYIPRVEVDVQEVVEATVVLPDTALQLRAKRATTDQSGVKRKAGEEWLVRETGAYLPDVDEAIVSMNEAYIITTTRALHVEAKKAFTDFYGKPRKAGEEWLITLDQTDTHIKDVDEKVIGYVDINTVDNRQYCVVLDPYVDGVQRFGAKDLRKGPCNFFLNPGESLENGIEEVIVLAEDEALLLQANELLKDPVLNQESKTTETVVRQPGDRWMIYGPSEYIPPVEVEVVETRKAIPLDLIEGIYVRDTKTGQVNAMIGETYMLKPSEELWEKELSEETEFLLTKQNLGQTFAPAEGYGGVTAVQRDRTRVVTFRAAENSAVQVYDYKKKTARVVFGPDMIMLMPDEHISIVRLSGGKPKKPGLITSLCLNLGPDFMTDIVSVETADHARLNLKLSYNWHFQVEKTDEHAEQIFSVRDFVGDACKTVASRVRGAVATETFDNFHKHSARIIRISVFGEDDFGKIKDTLTFNANRLIITNVDIQSVEPVEEDTRVSLQKSVQMAIEITTNSQEARARHDAQREEEEAQGRLTRQRVQNQALAEEAKKELLELKAESNAIESSGQAKAEAKARAEAAAIEGGAAVEQARLRAEARNIEAKRRLDEKRSQQENEVTFLEQMNALEIEKAQALSAIEEEKFKGMVEALGPQTIAAIARAGPETQAELLKGLGLSGFMITDGKSPINLFNTANGLIAGGTA